ncbi:MAG: acyl carrier protein [Deltaproteobacteria bacterium]|nr:acyl carrier protein [Deltaproteobacteria bacterium]
MAGNSLLERIKRLVVDALELGVQPDGLPDDLDLTTGGTVEIDSIEVVALVLALEHEFRIKLQDEDLDLSNFSTLSAMAALVQKKLGEKDR